MIIWNNHVYIWHINITREQRQPRQLRICVTKQLSLSRADSYVHSPQIIFSNNSSFILIYTLSSDNTESGHKNEIW